MSIARRSVGSARGALVVALTGLCFSACKGKSDAKPQAVPSAAPSAASSVGAEKGAVRSVKPKTPEKKPPSAGAERAVVKIPAGKLIAGTPCGDHPRSPSIELAGIEVQLAAFDIDAYPYPNDPRQRPKTGVTREEAAQLCAERGRRLCSELE